MKKSWKLIVIGLVAIFMFGGCTDSVPSEENSGYVQIPCQDYKAGTIKTMQSTSSKKIKIYTRVISSKDGRIVIRPSGAEIITLIEKDGMISIESSKTQRKKSYMNSETKYTPPLPLCGKVPTFFETSAENPSKVGVPSFKQAVKIRKIGEERIKIKAGEFDTVVIEKRTKRVYENPEMLGLESFERIYIAQKFGVVKAESIHRQVPLDEKKLLEMSGEEKSFAKALSEVKTRSMIEMMSYKEK